MDAFYERLIVRAATIDELLSDDFESPPGEQGDPEQAARRFAAWAQSSASGDRSLFAQRLQRDGWATDDILAKFATIRRKKSAVQPAWVQDAIWIEAALQTPGSKFETRAAGPGVDAYPFEHLFAPVVEQAAERLWAGVNHEAAGNLTEAARASLAHSLLRELCNFCAPAIYEQFATARKTGETSADGTSRYDQFIGGMKSGGIRRLFEDRPVLLRLMAVIIRQWLETSREFVVRLDADFPAIRRDILGSDRAAQVAMIEGDLSDPHNDGRSVRIITFADGARVVYKPKDLRLDIVWLRLIEQLNAANPPIDLKAMRAVARDGFGWTEFIDHAGTDAKGCRRFFRRAGAWLALFHCFVANDMHQENMIASGDYPVPIDLETILQPALDARDGSDPEAQAFDLAMEKLANSVMMVGLLPAYGRAPDNKVFAIGGMTADWNLKIRIKWDNINSDEMRPARAKETKSANPNLPHVDGRYAKFADHIEVFISGFEDYAKFLLRQRQEGKLQDMYESFAGLPVRKVVRATRFYSMLIQRLKNPRTMDDGIAWSAQADFVARLAEWDKDDVLWPLHRAERSALLSLNIPHFVSRTDASEISDAAGFSIRTGENPGIARARARFKTLDKHEIDWQIEVIRENLKSLSTPLDAASPAPAKALDRQDVPARPSKDFFIAEADRIAGELSRCAVREGPGAAWIGLDWLGDAEVFQLVCLGADLYNGTSGIAVFLAAHAAVSGHEPSAELARAAIAHLRKNLKSRNAPRTARAMGIGGATGLGSIVYALAVMSKCLRDDGLLADAHVAAELFSDALIAADKQLDVIGGSAGGILSLLRLYRDSRSAAVLERATKCGEHLIAQSRIGPDGQRSWVGQGSGKHALNGMSHGAAGFAYALAALAAATGREDFAQAASDCVAFENATYDAGRRNWPDLRADGQPSWPCQWCHGAIGIGLARIGMTRQPGAGTGKLEADIRNAVEGVVKGWPGPVDTLCCGTLGSVEFFCEAGDFLGRDDLRELAARRLAAVLEAAAATGDFRWNSGKRQFNLGLFRGLAGVGYTALRQADNSLPNVLMWE